MNNLHSLLFSSSHAFNAPPTNPQPIMPILIISHSIGREDTLRAREVCGAIRPHITFPMNKAFPPYTTGFYFTTLKTGKEAVNTNFYAFCTKGLSVEKLSVTRLDRRHETRDEREPATCRSATRVRTPDIRLPQPATAPTPRYPHLHSRAHAGGRHWWLPQKPNLL